MNGNSNESTRALTIEEKRSTTIKDPKFDVVWEGQPSGLWGRFLSSIHLNFTWYKITKDELMIVKGFLLRRTDTIELYLLKDPDLKESLWQRLFKVGSVRVKVDSKSNSSRAGSIIVLKNVQTPNEVRKLLRDFIEADVMERGINYFDRV